MLIYYTTPIYTYTYTHLYVCMYVCCSDKLLHNKFRTESKLVRQRYASYQSSMNEGNLFDFDDSMYLIRPKIA